MFKGFFHQKKLITFDLDGTIIKSNKIWDQAFEEVGAMLTSQPITLGSFGETVIQRWQQIIQGHAITNNRPMHELIELTHTAFIKRLDQLELTEGFWPLVAELKLVKNLQLALVTNTARVITDRIVAALELKPVFDFIICGDEVKKPKPDPEIYKKTLAQFKVAPKAALAFEDALVGCISAAKAGIKVICLWDEVTPQSKFPDEVIEFTRDFTPFSGELDTTYYEDIVQAAKEEEEKEAANPKT